MNDRVPQLVLLAAVSNVLLQEIERPDSRHLADERFRNDLRAFTARVEAELDAASGRQRPRLAHDGESVVTGD